jgi:hypothetical protein
MFIKVQVSNLMISILFLLSCNNNNKAKKIDYFVNPYDSIIKNYIMEHKKSVAFALYIDKKNDVKSRITIAPYIKISESLKIDKVIQKLYINGKIVFIYTGLEDFRNTTIKHQEIYSNIDFSESLSIVSENSKLIIVTGDNSPFINLDLTPKINFVAPSM